MRKIEYVMLFFAGMALWSLFSLVVYEFIHFCFVVARMIEKNVPEMVSFVTLFNWNGHDIEKIISDGLLFNDTSSVVFLISFLSGLFTVARIIRTSPMIRELENGK